MGLVAALLAIAVAMMPRVQPALRLVATNPVFVTLPDGRQAAEFDISNPGNETVIAWGVDVELTFSNSTVGRVSTGRDGYATHAGVGPERPIPDPTKDTVVKAHASLHSRLPFTQANSRTVVGVSAVTIRWAVFADGSWIGDEADVKAVFRQRELDCEAYAFIVRALRAGHASGSGRDALKVTLDQLNTTDQQDFENADKRVMRRNIQMALDGKLAATPRDFLRYWILKTEAKWAAADEHRRMGSRRPYR